MTTLLLTIGLPRAGKSTWVKSAGFPVVNKDAIRIALHGEMFKVEAEPMVHVIAQTMVKALFGAGHDTVILDETNICKRTRDTWRSNDGEWSRAYKEFTTTPFICQMRALECEVDGKYPKGHAAVMYKVIADKHARYEPVCESENMREWDGKEEKQT